jgi:hypothetical protein
VVVEVESGDHGDLLAGRMGYTALTTGPGRM